MSSSGSATSMSFLGNLTGCGAGMCCALLLHSRISGMIKRLEVKAFRGLSGLVLDDLARVNILVGGNGVGKTSVLESIALILGANNPTLIGALSGWREFPVLQLVDDEGLRSLFPSMDLDHALQINIANTGDGKLQTLKIEAIQNTQTYLRAANGAIRGLDLPEQFATGDTKTLLGASYTYTSATGNSRAAHLLLQPGGVVPIVPKPFNAPSSFYIYARRATSNREIADMVTRMISSKQRDTLMEALRVLDARVKDVLIKPVSGGQALVLLDVGLPNYIPMNALGDGFCRTALILTGLLSRSGTVLVDEIDSGLHPSSMQLFWANIRTLAEKFPFQLFCTTHNEEMLENTLSAFASSPDALRIYRIQHAPDGGTAATKFDYALYQDSDAAGFDIRGSNG